MQIVVSWPSQQRQRKLKDCLEPLGKAMLRGTWSDIARASFKVSKYAICLDFYDKFCLFTCVVGTSNVLHYALFSFPVHGSPKQPCAEIRMYYA